MRALVLYEGGLHVVRDRVQDRLVDVEPLVHARCSLERAHDAFEHAARPGVLKVLLDVA